MKVFLDTEHTGLHQDTTLISIGLISEDSQTFYAEYSDYNREQVDSWIIENVFNNLRFKDKSFFINKQETFDDKKWSIEMKGTTDDIRRKLRNWLTQPEISQIEMWGDCLAYDWVLFNNMFKTALGIPKYIYYIPFDICTLMKIKGIDPDINRENFADYHTEESKHNALWDAIIIKKCYEKLVKLKEVINE